MLKWNFDEDYEKYRTIKKTYSCFRCAVAKREAVELRGTDIPYDDPTITVVRDVAFTCENKRDGEAWNRVCPNGNKDFQSRCNCCIHSSIHIATVNPKYIKLPAKDAKNLTVKHELFHCDQDPDGVYNRGYMSCENFKEREQQDNGKKNK